MVGQGGFIGHIASGYKGLGQRKGMDRVIPKGLGQQVAASAQPQQFTSFDRPVYQVIAALFAAFNDPRQLGICQHPVGQIKVNKLFVSVCMTGVSSNALRRIKFQKLPLFGNLHQYFDKAIREVELLLQLIA